MVVYPDIPASPPLDKPPREGSFAFLMNASNYFDVMLVSELAHNWILHRYFKRHGWKLSPLTGHPIGLQLESRPPRYPHIFIGARVMRFTGEWPDVSELTKQLPHPDSRQDARGEVASHQEHPE